MRSTGLRDIIKHDALLSLVVLQQLWLVHFDPCWSGICSLGGLLSHGSPVVVFFDRGHLRFRNFYSPIPVNVVRVKSSVNCLFDLARVVIRVTINKLYFVPEWLVSGVVGMLWNGGGLRTGESNVSIVNFYCYSPRWITTTFSTDKKLFERWNYDIMISLNLLFRTLLWFFLYQDMEGNIDWLDSTAAVISLSSSYLMQIF